MYASFSTIFKHILDIENPTELYLSINEVKKYCKSPMIQFMVSPRKPIGPNSIFWRTFQNSFNWTYMKIKTALWSFRPRFPFRWIFLDWAVQVRNQNLTNCQNYLKRNLIQSNPEYFKNLSFGRYLLHWAPSLVDILSLEL